MTEITLIAALDEGHLIGREGQLPWKLSGDLRHFRRATMGKPIVMGRKTHQSIGRPLDGRLNIVLSRSADFEAPGCVVVSSVDEALEAAAEAAEIMVIGGATVYAAFLPVATAMLLTLVHARLDGDAFFPQYDPDEWLVVETEGHGADAKNQYAFDFVTLRRKAV